MTKKKQTIQLIKPMLVAALKKSADDLGKQALKIKLEKATEKGGKDLHAYLKKRKEIAWTKTILGLKMMKGEQNGEA